MNELKLFSIFMIMLFSLFMYKVRCVVKYIEAGS